MGDSLQKKDALDKLLDKSDSAAGYALPPKVFEEAALALRHAMIDMEQTYRVNFINLYGKDPCYTGEPNKGISPETALKMKGKCQINKVRLDATRRVIDELSGVLKMLRSLQRDQDQHNIDIQEH